MVFGAGPVGLRKASYLSREADVVLVDRKVIEAPEGMKVVRGEALEHLSLIDEADLVVAATGDIEVDSRICEMARKKDVPFNRSNGAGEFIIPSVVERRNFSVAISTLGRSPGMSRHIRLILERELSPVLEDMVDLCESLREELKATIPDAVEREGRLRKVLDDERVWEALTADWEKAMNMAREALR